MDEPIKRLGKVVPTREGAWNRFKEYDDLSMVYDETTLVGYISRKKVPVGVNLTNREYWQPNNVTGFADDNIIIINDVTESGSLKSYNLETIIKTIPDVGRKLGNIICFYNGNEDREDIKPSWEMWQFNSVDIRNWEDATYWVDCLHKYVYSTWLGWLKSKNILLANYPRPVEGMMAFVGDTTEDTYVYRAEYDEFSKIIVWSRHEKVSDELKQYISIIESVNLITERLINEISILKNQVAVLTEEVEQIKHSI